MAASAIVATRMEPELKRRAEDVLRRERITGSQLIRRLYSYVATHGAIPSCIMSVEYDGRLNEKSPDKFDDMVAWISGAPFASEDFSFLTDEVVAQTLKERGEAW